MAWMWASREGSSSRSLRSCSMAAVVKSEPGPLPTPSIRRVRLSMLESRDGGPLASHLVRTCVDSTTWRYNTVDAKSVHRLDVRVHVRRVDGDKPHSKICRRTSFERASILALAARGAESILPCKRENGCADKHSEILERQPPSLLLQG